MNSKGVSAPEVNGMARAFRIWKRTHLGSKEDFYKFMTSPSVEREEFLSSLYHSPKMSGGVVINIYEA